jgi:hypothetical protein
MYYKPRENFVNHPVYVLTVKGILLLLLLIIIIIIIIIIITRTRTTKEKIKKLTPDYVSVQCEMYLRQVLVFWIFFVGTAIFWAILHKRLGRPFFLGSCFLSCLLNRFVYLYVWLHYFLSRRGALI